METPGESSITSRDHQRCGELILKPVGGDRFINNTVTVYAPGAQKHFCRSRVDVKKETRDTGWCSGTDLGNKQLGEWQERGQLLVERAPKKWDASSGGVSLVDPNSWQKILNKSKTNAENSKCIICFYRREDEAKGQTWNFSYLSCAIPRTLRS